MQIANLTKGTYIWGRIDWSVCLCAERTVWFTARVLHKLLAWFHTTDLKMTTNTLIRNDEGERHFNVFFTVEKWERERQRGKEKERERKINRWRPRINPGFISNRSNPASPPFYFFHLAFFHPLFVFIWCICNWKRRSVSHSLLCEWRFCICLKPECNVGSLSTACWFLNHRHSILNSAEGQEKERLYSRNG